MKNNKLFIMIFTSLLVVNSGGMLNAQIYHVAKYCESARFDLESHSDEFVVDYYIPCWNV